MLYLLHDKKEKVEIGSKPIHGEPFKVDAQYHMYCKVDVFGKRTKENIDLKLEVSFDRGETWSEYLEPLPYIQPSVRRSIVFPIKIMPYSFIRVVAKTKADGVSMLVTAQVR